MVSTLSRDYLPLVRQLSDDVSAKVARRPVFTHLLDHALLALELRRALGPDADVADPRDSFRAAMQTLGAEPEAGPWLYRGAAQAGWLALQLARDADGSRAPAGLSTISDLVMSWLLDYPDTADVDLPRGVLGLGVFALNHPDRGVRDKLLGAVLDVLERRVERDDDGVFIRLAYAPEREQDGSAGCRIIGVAHGTAGLVSFLSSVVLARTGAEDRVRPLLDDALRWLLAQRIPSGGESVFPHRVELVGPARPTWCSGDPGIALALDVAVRATGSPAAAETAADLRRVVLARPPERAGVVDACICHGAAGLIWYGHRLHADHGLADGVRLAEHWAGWVAEHRAEDRLTYFGPWGMVRDVSFLEGDCGVALALLQAVVGGSPCWEELLLAVPVGGR